MPHYSLLKFGSIKILYFLLWTLAHRVPTRKFRDFYVYCRLSMLKLSSYRSASAANCVSGDADVFRVKSVTLILSAIIYLQM